MCSLRNKRPAVTEYRATRIRKAHLSPGRNKEIANDSIEGCSRGADEEGQSSKGEARGDCWLNAHTGGSFGGTWVLHSSAIPVHRPANSPVFPTTYFHRVAKSCILVQAFLSDLKSRVPNRTYRFDSGSGHHLSSVAHSL